MQIIDFTFFLCSALKKGAHRSFCRLKTWKALENLCGNKHETAHAYDVNFSHPYSPAYKNFQIFPSENKSVKLNYYYLYFYLFNYKTLSNTT